MTTFPTILERLLRGEAARPFVTFYDHASDERIELSVTTYANWVAKTASLLAEELDLERGQSIRIDLPAHWLGPVFLGAAWTVGLVVDRGRRRRRGRVRPGPGRPLGGTRCRHDGARLLPAPAGHALRRAPARRRPRLRRGGLVAAGRVRAVRPARCPPTWRSTGTTQRELWDAAAAGSVLTDGGRVLTEENPASPSGIPSFTEPLVRGGSLVLVAHADPGRLEATYASEHATARFP